MEELTIYDPEQDETLILQVSPDVKRQVLNGNLQLAQELLLTAQKQESFKTAFKLIRENQVLNEVGYDLDTSTNGEISTEATASAQLPEEPTCSTGLHTSTITERSNMWDQPRTLLLLSKALAKKEHLESPRYKKGEIFKEIANEMKAEGKYNFTGEQCQNRMKTLINKYKTIKDHNNKTGNNAKEWTYFKLVEEYLGDRPSVTPKVSCSSLALSKEKSVIINERVETPAPAKQRRIVKHSTPRNEMLKWLKAQAEEQKKMEEHRLEQLSQQHKENTELFKQFLEIIKKN